MGVRAWALTVPQTVEWDDYQRELDDVASGERVLNYRVWGFPEDMAVGDRCYVVWRGAVRGWMRITGMVRRDAFTCLTTGRRWPAGRYIQRSGRFHRVKDGVAMRGFRGLRRFELETEDVEGDAG